jgi:hypothetical protein
LQLKQKSFEEKFSRACGNLIVLFKKLKQRVLKKIFLCLWEFDCPLQEIEAKSFEENLLVLVGI